MRMLSLNDHRTAVKWHTIDHLSVEPVVEGAGWALLEALTAMFSDLPGR
jgi:hypothetical protein